VQQAGLGGCGRRSRSKIPHNSTREKSAKISPPISCAPIAYFLSSIPYWSSGANRLDTHTITVTDYPQRATRTREWCAHTQREGSSRDRTAEGKKKENLSSDRVRASTPYMLGRPCQPQKLLLQYYNCSLAHMLLEFSRGIFLFEFNPYFITRRPSR